MLSSQIYRGVVGGGVGVVGGGLSLHWTPADSVRSQSWIPQPSNLFIIIETYNNYKFGIIRACNI